MNKIQGFDFNKIDTVEFYINVKKDEVDQLHSVPIDKDVKYMLEIMLAETVKLFNNSEEISDYDLLSKYSSAETLKADLSDAVFAPLVKVINNNYKSINSDVIKSSESISFYKVVFYDTSGLKVTAIRKASYFKSILRQKGRLVRIFSDSLMPVTDDIFKLDHDFDFFVINENAYVKNPNNFISIAKIDTQLISVANEKISELKKCFSYINFDTIQEKSKTSNRVAKLIISISKRDDNDKVSRELLLTNINNANVRLKAGETIEPEIGHEIGLLDVLDRRRLTCNLIEGKVEVYQASNRRQLTLNKP